MRVAKLVCCWRKAEVEARFGVLNLTREPHTFFEVAVTALSESDHHTVSCVQIQTTEDGVTS